MITINELADRHLRLYAKHQAELGEHTTNALCVVADRAFLESFSGQVTWATLLNLVVRLYKGIHRLRLVVEPSIVRLPHVFFPNDIRDIRGASLQMLNDLHGGHMVIEEAPPDDGDPALRVYVGAAKKDVSAAALTVAGRGWVAFINDDGWRGLADDLNPLGPMAAACLGTAEAYRRLYAARSRPLQALVFSTFRNADPSVNPAMPADIHLPRTFVPGAGAIGMGLMLALQSMPSIRSSDGVLVVDDDRLDVTNLNRCLLAILADVSDQAISLKKIDLLKRRVRHGGLNLQAIDDRWQAFVRRRAHDDARDYEIVLSCVDKYEARMAVQYDKPPKVLITAGTADFLLTVSRHVLSDGMSCGLCYQFRDRAPTCDKASEGAQEAFENPIDPSIGFVSAMAAVLMAAEYMKEIRPEWHDSRVDNSLRVYVLSGRVKAGKKPKDPNCNCSSKYVAMGYNDIWGSHRGYTPAPKGSLP
jgi:molybdopterin/thiamine biosynthesis adenylyltransferase